jgi:hypothetical protein
MPYWTEFWVCLGCKKRFAAPFAKFQALKTILGTLSTDTDLVFFACEACSRISAYNKKSLPAPRMLSNLDSESRQIVIDRVFAIDIECGDLSCKALTRIYEPTGKHYDENAVRAYLETGGSCDSSVSCPDGHPAMNPVRVAAVCKL